ncbi:MAG: hypothetical protein JWL64_1851 [Frankiales bacterium]|nr:hypothetical protein [Frankiales bacterium]
MLSWGRGLRIALSALTAGALLAFAVPHLSGAHWADTLPLIRSLTLWQVGLLLALWMLGPLAHTVVATAALPRLTCRQALVLNLSGGAIANLVPFGGALGMGLHYKMLRTWGFSRESFTSFTTVTSLCNVLTKLALPVVATGLLLAHGGLPPSGLRSVATAVLLSGAVVFAAVVALLWHPRGLTALAVATQRLIALGLRAVRVDRRVDLVPATVAARGDTLQLLRRHGGRMAAGMLLLGLLQAGLLWSVLACLGSSLGPVQVFAGFALGRALSLLVITPGGVGFSETGMATLLIALGGDPTVIVAGTLLFTGLIFLLEIPVGGLCGLHWWHTTRRTPAAHLDSLPATAV